MSLTDSRRADRHDAGATGHLPGIGPSAAAFLDMLRFVAVNLVMLSHILVVFFDDRTTYQGRGAAVVILFVLSGFLITRSLLGRLEQPGPQLPVFLADRVARVMTPLVPVLLAIALLNATVIHTHWSLEGLSTGFVALLGNLLLLFDYPLFQFFDASWRVRPYHTAEPLWTLPIVFWIYIAAGVLVFGVLAREKIRPACLWALALISLPVVVWNAAGGPGKALSLVWMMGCLAGFLGVQASRHGKPARSKALPVWLLLFGSAALVARIWEDGFDPYDLQTALLVTVIFFALFLRLNQATTVWKFPAALAKFFASYSYSLYLVHNTVLVIVFETTAGWPKAWSIGIGVMLGHGAALLAYHSFEKRHRTVGTFLRRILARYMTRPEAASPSDPRGKVTAAAIE